MIYYLPIEDEPMRYTGSLHRHILDYLVKNDLPTQVINPHISSIFNRELPAGHFLDAPKTIAYKSAQLLKLAELYVHHVPTHEPSIVFLSDMWFPGIEAVRYMDFFTKRKVSLRGILHAGSFTDTDFVRQLERWAAMYENTLFDIFDRVIVASEFIKHEVCSRRLLDERKVVVTPFPLDERARYTPGPRENIVIFNGRLCDEKQPHLFREMQRRLQGKVRENTQWISTQELRLSQFDYYSLLKRAKVVVSFALQENFGFGIAEATMCGCFPVVPDRLVYPEFYHRNCRYASFEDACNMVEFGVNFYERISMECYTERLIEKIKPDMTKWFSND